MCERVRAHIAKKCRGRLLPFLVARLEARCETLGDSRAATPTQRRSLNRKQRKEKKREAETHGAFSSFSCCLLFVVSFVAFSRRPRSVLVQLAMPPLLFYSPAISLPFRVWMGLPVVFFHSFFLRAGGATGETRGDGHPAQRGKKGRGCGEKAKKKKKGDPCQRQEGLPPMETVTLMSTFTEPQAASDSPATWMHEGDPQRVWIVSCPGAPLPATQQRHVCLTPSAAARRAVRMALVARHRGIGKAVRGLARGRSRLDDIDGVEEEEKRDTGRAGNNSEAFDYAINLDRLALSAGSLRWWSNSMAPGDVFDFCWYDETRAYDGIGRIECVTSFGDPSATARSSQAHTAWSIVIYGLLMTVGLLFVMSLLGGGRRRRC